MRPRSVTRVYIALPGFFFDPGTEADLVEDFREDGANAGMFLGFKNGKLTELCCEFTEFEVKIVRED